MHRGPEFGVVIPQTWDILEWTKALGRTLIKLNCPKPCSALRVCCNHEGSSIGIKNRTRKATNHHGFSVNYRSTEYHILYFTISPILDFSRFCRKSFENSRSRWPWHDPSITWSAMIRIGLPWGVQSHLGNTAQVTGGWIAFLTRFFQYTPWKEHTPNTEILVSSLGWRGLPEICKNWWNMLRNNCHGSLFLT